MTGAGAEAAEVLIVEDDAAIAEGLALNLRLAGFRPEVAHDGEAAAERIHERVPDLVLLDISLPRKNGLELLGELRAAGLMVPVIVLSARQDEFDKVAALRLGADDYVTKPFALAELMARVGAVLRRAGLTQTQAQTQRPRGEGVLTFGDVVIDPATRTVTRDSAPVKLTHLEFELLAFLARNVSRVLSREVLLREVWGYRRSETARTVDNFVAQLRSKLEADPEAPRHLVTVRGSGYRFDP
ncbi:MAG: response regulator transcription factor [Deltaproteobacteria bacterium]|nr:response regulator transcription factor [Deltaproteobacteria bacterium]